MKVRFRVAPLFGLALAGTALAQTPAEGSLKAKPPEAPPATEGRPGEMDVDGNYTIKKGDTLWDLSQQFLNNPWYWPKIWADNPSVENPHWIYPGNRLKISRQGSGLPGEIGPLSAEDDAPFPPPDEGEEIRNKEPEDFSTGSVRGAGSFARDSDLVTMGGSGSAGRAAKLGPHVRMTNIVTQGELESVGEVTHSAEQKTLLAQYDKIYMKMERLNDVKIGTRYTVFRRGEQVMHPQTGEPFGYRVYLLGGVDVIGKTDSEAIGVIGRVTADIERGDRLAIIGDLDKPVQAVSNDADVTGTVLSSEAAGMTLAGQNHIVFIDKGSKDNVKVGNTFEVIHGADGLQRLTLPGEKVQQPTGPGEVAATLVVFNVTEHTCAAMVVKALHEVSVGDRVEMRRGGALSAGAGGDVR